jgi:hypothetical protein
MGVLLIACARRSRALATLRRPLRPTRADRVSTGLILAGIAVVVWGVFTFDPWTFAGFGPTVIGAGLLLSLSAYQKKCHR